MKGLANLDLKAVLFQEKEYQEEGNHYKISNQFHQRSG